MLPFERPTSETSREPARRRQARRPARRPRGPERGIGQAFPRAGWSPSWVATASARRRCCARCRVCIGLHAGTISLAGVAIGGMAPHQVVAGVAQAPKAGSCSATWTSPRTCARARCTFRAPTSREGSTTSAICSRSSPSGATSRRVALGRRAADGLHRAVPDGLAAGPAARRAVTRPGAEDGGPHLRSRSHRSGQRVSPSCWSSRTRGWRCAPPTTPMCSTKGGSRSKARRASSRTTNGSSPRISVAEAKAPDPDIQSRGKRHGSTHWKDRRGHRREPGHRQATPRCGSRPAARRSWCHYRGNKAMAEDVVRRIEAEGGSAFVLQSDLSDPAAPKQFYERLDPELERRFGSNRFRHPGRTTPAPGRARSSRT